MSVPQKGNGFPKMGKELPMAAGTASLTYAPAIAEALAVELKGSHRAIKTVSKWTGASERTAKNWLSGRRCPSGQHLIALLGRSDALMERVLMLSGRGAVIELRRLEALREAMVQVIAAIEAIKDRTHSSSA
jgi:hypothetical protein